MITVMEMHKEKCASEIVKKKIDVFQAITWIKNTWDSLTPETIHKCFKRCGFATENDGEDGRFIFFLYVCTCVTNYQYLAFLLNNKMFVMVIHFFLALNYNSHTGNKFFQLNFVCFSFYNNYYIETRNTVYNCLL